ncbi:MAG: cell division protein ZapA [Clostridia bacterium]|nr:cell division protein ZapA [Clostridia bacterium]
MKNKCKVEISGIELSVLSDNSKEQVLAMAKGLDDKIFALTQKPYGYTVTGAAIICALDSLEENKRLSKEIAKLSRTIESQKLDIEILKIENEKLTGRN